MVYLFWGLVKMFNKFWQIVHKFFWCYYSYKGWRVVSSRHLFVTSLKSIQHNFYIEKNILPRLPKVAIRKGLALGQRKFEENWLFINENFHHFLRFWFLKSLFIFHLVSAIKCVPIIFRIRLRYFLSIDWKFDRLFASILNKLSRKLERRNQ